MKGIIEKIADNDPELLKPLNSIPDPDNRLNRKGIEYYYRICSLLNDLNRVKCICAESLALAAVEMENGEFFRPVVKPTTRPLESRLHNLSEYLHRQRELSLTALTIGVTLAQIEKAGVPILSLLNRYKNNGYRAGKITE